MVSINGKPLLTDLDTSTVSVISEHDWKHLFEDTVLLEPYTGPPLCGYSGHHLEVGRQATVQVNYGQQAVNLPFVVIAGMQQPALFGQNW